VTFRRSFEPPPFLVDSLERVARNRSTRFVVSTVMATPARLLAGVIALAFALAAPDAAAKVRGLKAGLAPDDVSIDGETKEWDGEWRDLGFVVQGDEPDKSDLGASALVAYDREGIYVAAQVNDDKLVGGGDHVELVLGVPGGKLQSFLLYPGAPGKRAEVKAGKSSKVSGAEIVEAPFAGGWGLEARIPWSAVPQSATVRVGYRGAILVHDADAGPRVETSVGTAPGRDYASLPPLSTLPEVALGGGLLREKGLTQAPKHNLLADVVGDAMKERVLVYGRYVVVLGPGYRDGEQYYFRDLGASAERGDLLVFEVRDLTGDGKDDLLVRKRIRGQHGAVEVLEVLSYHAGEDTPSPVFAQEVRLALEGGEIANDVKVSGSGSRTRIVVSAGTSEGIDAARFERESNTGANPVLEPWGPVASQTWEVRDGQFVVADEKTRASERVASAPPPPPAKENVRSDAQTAIWTKPAPGPDPEQVYALYKKQAKVSSSARFDLSDDLAEDDRDERVVVHDRDLVVFGAGFRGGRGFAAITLAQFEKSADIEQVTARDVTRDGKAEVLVRGVLRSPLPSDVGDGDMVRQVLMIYQVQGGQFERIFAVELGRRVGEKRIEAKMDFSENGDHAIEIRPGRAVGYSADTYPWRQKTEPDGGFEPLLLPWGGIDKVRLRYDGEKFVRL
jgi:hypothetical protein